MCVDLELLLVILLIHTCKYYLTLRAPDARRRAAGDVAAECKREHATIPREDLPPVVVTH